MRRFLHQLGARGFSLVELSVYIVVLGVVLSLSFAVMLNLMQAQQSSQETRAAGSGEQLLSGQLLSDVMSANFLSAPTQDELRVAVPVGGSYTCITWVYSTAAQTLERYQTGRDTPVGVALTGVTASPAFVVIVDDERGTGNVRAQLPAESGNTLPVNQTFYPVPGMGDPCA